MMDNFSEVIKIIEGGLEGNRTKVMMNDGI